LATACPLDDVDALPVAVGYPPPVAIDDVARLAGSPPSPA